MFTPPPPSHPRSFNICKNILRDSPYSAPPYTLAAHRMEEEERAGAKGRRRLDLRRKSRESSIFCVTKLDWQFIGNIRLRGVTPAFRVRADRQKSPDSAVYSSGSNPKPFNCCVYTLLVYILPDTIVIQN